MVVLMVISTNLYLYMMIVVVVVIEMMMMITMMTCNGGDNVFLKCPTLTKSIPTYLSTYLSIYLPSYLPIYLLTYALGDGVPPDFNFSNSDHASKFIPFMKQFDFELNTKDKIIDCVSYLKDKHHVVKAALLGFCWGCWLIAWVLSENSGVAHFFNSAVIAHPSIGAEERFHGR